MKGLSDHKLSAPFCLTILAAIFQLITATSWQALSKKTICYPKLTDGAGWRDGKGQRWRRSNIPQIYRLNMTCNNNNVSVTEIVWGGQWLCRVSPTLPWLTAALPSSLPSSSSSSLHSQSPSSVLCRWPLEPGTRLTCTHGQNAFNNTHSLKWICRVKVQHSSQVS